ncbi:hypothetical protein I551_0765 [Mycobacterium ulcerans str. Harvey]|uniref:Uncharacterized protein n=1 Tax=Mycobacterium ulcerans str. Harvey TaxID=1299332 RepID=A0ABN0R739_MYCUL|nr:hypothetical protein I551_0765 [Mycobacterium ulcerans str. Harvey]
MDLVGDIAGGIRGDWVGLGFRCAVVVGRMGGNGGPSLAINSATLTPPSM